MNRIIKRMAIPLSAAAVLGTAGFAYMATNSMPSNTYAGAGDSPISGYQVSNVHYVLGNHGTSFPVGSGLGTDGNEQITAVTFDLSPSIDLSTGTLYALVQNGNTYSSYKNCTNTTGSTYTCTLTTGSPATPFLEQSTQLQVIAAQ